MNTEDISRKALELGLVELLKRGDISIAEALDVLRLRGYLMVGE